MRTYPPRQRAPYAKPSSARVPPTQAAPSASREEANWNTDINNPIRVFGLWLALAFVFVRFTLLHELLSYKLGFNSYLLYLLGVPAILALLLSGGVARTLRWRAAWFWLLFLAWLFAATPTSVWRADTLRLVFTYARTEIIVLFLIAGLVMTWKECWRLLYVLSLAAIGNVLIGHFFAADMTGADSRLQLQMQEGTMSNSNDYAALMTLLLPFLVLLVIAPGRAFWLRIAGAAATVYGVYLVLATGSRGALVALIIALLYTLMWLRLPFKILFLFLAVILGVFLAAVLPDRIASRLATTVASSADDAALTAESEESADSRMYLLKRSLVFTMQRPIFGVGPGQFAIYEAKVAKDAGVRGSWHDTHNTFTQISSEAGIPAFLLYLAALISTYRLLSRVYRRSRNQPSSPESPRVAVACFCVLLSFVAFSAASFFLSLAYRFYLPAITGVAIALSRATEHEWRQARPGA